MLEKEKAELELDLSNTSDRKHTAKDDRQIGQLQSYDEKVSDMRNQCKEEQEKRKNLDIEVSGKICREKSKTYCSSICFLFHCCACVQF